MPASSRLTVSDVLTKLAFGELADHPSVEEGSVIPTQVDRVVSHIDSALTAIYARFSHKRHYVKLHTTADRAVYPLTLDHVGDHTVDPNLYIEDEDDDPYTGVLMKIVDVSLENESDQDSFVFNPAVETLGHTHSGRDAYNGVIWCGVTQVSDNAIRIPKELRGSTFDLKLIMNHPRLTLPAVTTEPVIIAPPLEEALRAKVGATMYGSMGGELHMGNSRKFAAEYERVCALSEGHDHIGETSDLRGNDLFWKNGWV